MGEHSKDLPVTVDYEAEAMYIKLSNEKTHHTQEITSEMNFDLNENGEIIGIEILRKPVITDITFNPLYTIRLFVESVLEKYDIVDYEITTNSMEKEIQLTLLLGLYLSKEYISNKFDDFVEEFRKYFYGIGRPDVAMNTVIKMEYK